MARILLIEDEPALRALFCRGLVQAGHDVFDSEDGTSALGLLSLVEADIVVADVNLRGEDGIATLIAIHRSFPRLVLVAISGGDLGEISGRLEDSGFDRPVRLLSKPFVCEELVATVRMALSDLTPT